MSQSTPVCHLKCSRCHANAPSKERHGDAPRSYINVKVTGRAGNAAVCECQRCGYVYRSNSSAARRRLRQLETHIEAAQAQGHFKGPAEGPQWLKRKPKYRLP